ncbi:MAG: glutamate racemase [Clostridia bacterium]|nr:glutamate racemase [Clostridia bacterium]
MFRLGPIGVFDSGIGGVSVLSELIKIMPCEDYIYIADVKNAPYGDKSAEEILRCAEVNVKRLEDMKCKAVVIACNTATAVAAETLRREFKLDVFGIEPAIKPAAMERAGGNILVLTTALTAEQARFKELVKRYDGYMDSRFYCTSVQKMVTFIERGMGGSEEALEYLEGVFKAYKNIRFTSCVLGCTHFPMAKKAIEKALGYEVEFFDGGIGTAKNVKRVLEEKELLTTSSQKGRIVLFGLGDKEIEQIKTTVKL